MLKVGIDRHDQDEIKLVQHMVEMMKWGRRIEDQSFISEALKKISTVRQLIDASGRDIMLEVDGGVKVENIAEIAKAGADTFVAGSAIFGKPDYKAIIHAMRGQLATV